MEKSQDITSLAKALAKFQSEVAAIRKDSENPYFKSKYASLENIIENIRKPLSVNALSFSQLPNGENYLTTILMHESGQWIQSNAKMSPKDTSPQSQGSAITYMRRYALSGILGLATEDDDDGNQATKPNVAIGKGGSVMDMDFYAEVANAIEKSTTQTTLLKLSGKIEKSTKLTDTQKDTLDRMISGRVDLIESKG